MLWSTTLLYPILKLLDYYRFRDFWARLYSSQTATISVSSPQSMRRSLTTVSQMTLPVYSVLYIHTSETLGYKIKHPGIFPVSTLCLSPCVEGNFIFPLALLCDMQDILPGTLCTPCTSMCTPTSLPHPSVLHRLSGHTQGASS